MAEETQVDPYEEVRRTLAEAQRTIWTKDYEAIQALKVILDAEPVTQLQEQLELAKSTLEVGGMRENIHSLQVVIRNVKMAVENELVTLKARLEK